MPEFRNHHPLSIYERVLMRFRRGKKTVDWFKEPIGVIDLALDSAGERYTTHAFALEGDAWYGAMILTPSCVARLRREKLLPLKVVS